MTNEVSKASSRNEPVTGGRLGADYERHENASAQGYRENVQAVRSNGYAVTNETTNKKDEALLTEPLPGESDGSGLQDESVMSGATVRTEPKVRRRIRHFGRVIWTCAAMAKADQAVRRVAVTDATVLLIGETGTGKELVAEAVHRMSKRRMTGFYPINCGAIPAALVESELLGHERGSFTGASQVHKGYFERADGGTLLLDEITEMPIELQVKLLRVLETGKVMRVGGTKEIPVNVRVIAATNRDPQEAVRDGKLRKDLLYRLAIFPLNIPPLRARQGDVEVLADYFLRKLNRAEKTDKFFSESALRKIATHVWPGNVRELRNLVSRAYILADKEITADDVETMSSPEASASTGSYASPPVGTSLADAEKQLILSTLEYHDGNKPLAADVLGISLKTLYNRLNTYKTE